MIILIDNCYPYEGGEPFLAKELEVASKLGEKIIIYPLNSNAQKSCRKVPDGIKVRSINKHSLLAVTLGIIYTPFDSMLWNDLKEILKNGISLSKITAALYYIFKTNCYTYLIHKDIKCNIEKGDKICIYSYWMHIQACIGAKLKSKLLGSTFVTRAHGYDLYEFRATSGFLPGRTNIFKTADHIFPVSYAGLNYLCQRYTFLSNSKVQVAYLGSCDNGLNPVKNKEIRIVSCSNLVPIKRVNLIIEALEMITDLQITWIHYGTGELLKSLCREASERLSKNISYSFEGYIPNDELMKCYSKTHFTFFINVSESEGLPVSIMEVMSFGIPTIATSVGGTCEIVESGINGYLVDKNVSPEELSYTLKKAVTMDDSDYIKMRIAARITWEKKFNATANYRHFYELLNRKEV